MNSSEPDQKDPPQHNTLMQTVGSVLAAFFGVQSSRNRHRDFTRGKAGHFIIIGGLMTVLFVVSLVVLVNLLIRFAG